MATVDSLEVQIKSEASSAVKSVDTLIGKIGELSNKLNSLNISNISSQVSKFVSSFKGINGNNFSELNRSAKEAEQAISKVSSATKGISNTKLSFNMSDYNDAIEKLGAKFADAGKNFKIDGNLSQLEKQYQKLNTELDKLLQREEKIISVGRIAPDSTGFTNLQFDISKTTNTLNVLKDAIDKLQLPKTGSFEQMNPDFKTEGMRDVTRSLESFKKSVQEIDSLMDKKLSTRVLDTLIEKNEEGLIQLQRTFPEQTKLIEDYKSKIESLKNLSIQVPEVNTTNVFTGIPEAAKYSVQEAQKSLSEALAQVHAEAPTGQFRNFKEEIRQATEKLKELESTGKTMGHAEWDDAYIALKRVKNEADEYKRSLNTKASGLDTDTQKAKALREQLKQLQVPEIRENNLEKLQNELEKTKQKMASLKIELSNQLTMGKITASVDDSGYVRMREQIALTGKTINALQDKIKAVKGIKIDGFSNTTEEVRSLENRVEELGTTSERTTRTLNKIRNVLKWVGDSVKGILGSLKTVGNGITSLFSKMGNIFKAAGSGVSAFTARLKQNIPFINATSKSTDTLIGKLTRLYIAYHSLRRIGRIFSEIVTSASDYIEEFNYFNVSISKIAQESQEDYKKYGYDSAKEYANSFKERLTDLTSKMTGFKIGENGELSTNVSMKNLGLNVTDITNFESRIAQMTNSVGMIGEASVVAAKGLTMLSGDLSSLANVPLQQVMNNLSSGLAGASMAVKKYGIDISVAALNEQAMSLGIEKSVSKMTQAEKEYLRVITMINQSKVAWGDLAKTIDDSEELLLVA